MRLTAQELERMKSVDIGAVSPYSLPDVSGMTFDNALSRKERVIRFLQVAKNLYCFNIGGVGVKIEFAEGGLFDPAKKRAVTSAAARPSFETKCPEAEPSLLSLWDRVII